MLHSAEASALPIAGFHRESFDPLFGSGDFVDLAFQGRQCTQYFRISAAIVVRHAFASAGELYRSPGRRRVGRGVWATWRPWLVLIVQRKVLNLLKLIDQLIEVFRVD